MAETVKKSRIVSAENDQNLEEAFMEEFNLRLKKCMSQVCYCDFFLLFIENTV